MQKPDGQIDKGAFERVASAIGKAAIEEYLRMISDKKFLRVERIFLNTECFS